MDYLKRFEPLFLFLVVIGALNWGMVGFFHTNVVTEVFSNGTVVDVIYAVVGVAGDISTSTFSYASSRSRAISVRTFCAWL